MTCTPYSTRTQRDAQAILNPIAHLAGPRHSSQEMSAAPLNSVQMKGTRHRVHDRLTDRSREYLETGLATPDLFVVDGLTRQVYALVAAETRRHARRSELKAAAVHEIIPSTTSTERHQGVAFYDPQDAWLYFVLARKSGSRWRTVGQVELPVPEIKPTRIEIGPLTGQLRLPAPSVASQIFVTD